MRIRAEVHRTNDSAFRNNACIFIRFQPWCDRIQHSLGISAKKKWTPWWKAFRRIWMKAAMHSLPRMVCSIIMNYIGSGFGVGFPFYVFSGLLFLTLIVCYVNQVSGSLVCCVRLVFCAEWCVLIVLIYVRHFTDEHYTCQHISIILSYYWVL